MHCLGNSGSPEMLGMALNEMAGSGVVVWSTLEGWCESPASSRLSLVGAMPGPGSSMLGLFTKSRLQPALLMCCEPMVVLHAVCRSKLR